MTDHTRCQICGATGTIDDPPPCDCGEGLSDKEYREYRDYMARRPIWYAIGGPRWEDV